MSGSLSWAIFLMSSGTSPIGTTELGSGCFEQPASHDSPISDNAGSIRITRWPPVRTNAVQTGLAPQSAAANQARASIFARNDLAIGSRREGQVRPVIHARP